MGNTEFSDGDAAWMLDRVLEQPEVLHALVVTADGLFQQHSGGLARDDAERLAAALAGMQSASLALAAFCAAQPGAWEQSLVQFAGGVVLTVRAGESTYLSVAVTDKADVGQIGWRMHEVTRQLGSRMGASPRAEADPAP